MQKNGEFFVGFSDKYLRSDSYLFIIIIYSSEGYDDV